MYSTFTKKKINTTIIVYSYVTSCSLVETYQRVGGRYCLHLQAKYHKLLFLQLSEFLCLTMLYMAECFIHLCSARDNSDRLVTIPSHFHTLYSHNFPKKKKLPRKICTHFFCGSATKNTTGTYYDTYLPRTGVLISP